MNKNVVLTLVILLCLCLLLVFSACKKATQNEFNIEKKACNGCGRCASVCPSDAIYYDGDNKAVIDQSKCTKCGECVAICPQHAIY